jgi:hypothetical protein
MSSIKALVGKKMTKNTKFMGADVAITKLSVAQVVSIQALAQNIAEDKDDESGLNLLKFVIREAVEGGSDLTDDDFKEFPMDELSKLSQEIMKFSGMGSEAGK